MNTKKKLKIVLAALFVCAAGILYSCGMYAQPEITQASGGYMEQTGDTQEEKTKPDETEALSYVYVYVCGAVASPGVYEVYEGARVFDAIEKAGGQTEEAALEALNLALPVKDGSKIYVPKAGEADPAVENSAGSTLVNINRADAAELMRLPGIGEAKAGQIIAYREKNGGFSSIEDLKRVPGIKAGVFEPIAELITVD